MPDMSNRTVCMSIWPLDMPRKHTLSFAAAQGVSFPLTILTNTVLIFVLYKTEQLASITNKFVLMMNLSDLSMGLIGQPLIVILFLIEETSRSCVLEMITEYVVFTSANFSWFMLICISIDRYLLITKLKRYKKFMNTKRMKILVLTSFAIANCLAAILLLAPSFEIQVVFNVANLTTMTLVAFLYWYIMRRLKVHNQRLQAIANQDAEGSSSQAYKQGQEDAASQSSALKTIKMLIIAIFVLYGPYNIASTYWTYYRFGQNGNPSTNLSVFLIWSYTIVLSNASINACIIIRGNSRARTYVREMLRYCLPATRVLPVKETTSTTEKQHTSQQGRGTICNQGKS